MSGGVIPVTGTLNIPPATDNTGVVVLPLLSLMIIVAPTSGAPVATVPVTVWPVVVPATVPPAVEVPADPPLPQPEIMAATTNRKKIKNLEIDGRKFVVIAGVFLDYV